jgi:hypothetical protein
MARIELQGVFFLRVFVCSLIGIPLLVFDAVLIFTLPARFSNRMSLIQAAVITGGAGLYLLFHYLIRKPERLYLWGHELTHLLVAKIFLREVHGFHITSRTGGKVVIDRTNVAIDLAPYAIPFYNLLIVVPALFVRGDFAFCREIYLVFCAFFFVMHLYFSLEGFFHGQSDLLRSGRIFSGGVVLFCFLLLVPILWEPVARTGFRGIASFYIEWFDSSFTILRSLLRYAGF